MRFHKHILNSAVIRRRSSGIRRKIRSNQTVRRGTSVKSSTKSRPASNTSVVSATKASTTAITKALQSVDLGTGSEYSKRAARVRFKGANYSVGSPRYMNKLVKSNKQSVWTTWRAIQPYLNTTVVGMNAVNNSKGGGAYWLNSYSPAASSAAYSQFMPLHMFDLTSTNQYVNGNIVSYNPSFQIMYDYPAAYTSNVAFSNMYGNGSTGGTFATSWQNLNTPGITTNNTPLSHSLLENVNIKMLCYGAANVATKWKIDVLQLKDDYLSPDNLLVSKGGSSNLGNTAGTDLRSSTTMFYESFMSHSMKHPIVTTDPKYKTMCKVLKSVNFITQPRLTNESDSATLGHTKEVNMFLDLKRTLKFDWADTQLDANNVSNPASWAANQSAFNNVVHPKARIYLAIQAGNYTSAIGTAGLSNTTCPTYDLIINQKQVFLE